MPNIKSAAKRVRQTKTRTGRNTVVKSRMKTYRKRVQAAVDAGDQEQAQAEFAAYASTVDKAAKKNVIHKNAAARYKSAMASAIASIES
ncbi:MAG: 30S ribosomal protein S20 [Verrucomicrobiota bacterium]